MKWKTICETIREPRTRSESQVKAPTAAAAIVIWRLHERRRRRDATESGLAPLPRRLVDLIWLDAPVEPESKIQFVPDHNCLDVPCPRCGAHVDEPCLNLDPDGLGPHYAHIQRDVVARVFTALATKESKHR